MELSGRAVFKNLNVRPEMHGDERELGVDLRLQLRAHSDDLAQFDPSLKALLYEKGEDERLRLRMPTLEPLKLTNTYDQHTLHLAEQSYDQVKIHRFELTPEPEGVVEIAFNVSVSAIDADLLPFIARGLLDQVVNVAIESQQGELDLAAA